MSRLINKILNFTNTLKIFTLTCLLIISACAKEIPSDQLVKKQGLYYEINTTTPFTGTTVSYHKNGNLSAKVNYKDGQLHGLSEEYYQSGQLSGLINYKDGPENYILEVYYESGQLKIKGYVKDGKHHGVWEIYYENGELEAIWDRTSN